MRRALAAAGALLCALCAGAPVAGRELRHVVKDPYFGDVLFYFYQDRYFSSVTDLMVAQHFGRLPHHEDEAEVLRGGLYLSYGLHREAGEIFARLIDRGAPPPVRDRAWFYLAKIRYQRGQLALAQEAIGRILHPLPPDLEEERGLLEANVLMALGDYAAAAKVLQARGSGSDSSLYVRYNLGVALVKSGDVEGGTQWLDQVGRAPAGSEEIGSLRDKANVALGYATLQDGGTERARGYLERVRLSGMLSNKALLGFFVRFRSR